MFASVGAKRVVVATFGFIIATTIWFLKILFTGGGEVPSPGASQLAVGIALLSAVLPDLGVIPHLFRRWLYQLGNHSPRLTAVCAFVWNTLLFGVTYLLLRHLTGVTVHWTIELALLALIGMVYPSVLKQADQQIGSHWLYGHHPLLVMLGCGVLCYQIGVWLVPGSEYFLALTSTATLFVHFWENSCQKELGIPWLAPLSLWYHWDSRFREVCPDEFFDAETRAYKKNINQSWRAALR